MKQAILGIQE